MKQILSLFHQRGWLLLVGLCLPSLSLVVRAQEAAASCSQAHRPEFYSQADYRVRTVSIRSPFGLVARSLASLKADLPLQPNSRFSLKDSNEGRKKIEARLEELTQGTDPRLRIRVVIAGIDNCQESEPHELDVIYWVITTDYNAYFSHTWELKNDEGIQPAAASDTAAQASGSARRLFTLSPYADYNRTRQLFGGAKAQLRIPGGVFESVDVNAAGSSAGSVAALDLSGSLLPERTALNRLDYRLGYQHTDLPADNNRLRQGIMHLQLFGATKPLGKHQVIVRFGATLEGGNQQTELVREAEAARSVANSGYGALKTYVGATWRSAYFALAGSYGVQFGTQGATTKVDFIKHIGDLALTARWVPGRQPLGEVHKALTLELQLGAGTIQTLGRVPVTERFFGGNATQYFIPDDDWRIRGGPFIRSIPQNRFGGVIGGTSFYSLNSTVAWTVWGRPLIPKDLATDPEFPSKWQGAQNIAHSALVGSYLNKFPAAFATIIMHFAPVEATLNELRDLFNSLPEEPPDELPENLRGQYQRTFRHVTKVRALVGVALRKKEELPSKLEGILKEPHNTTCMGPPLPPAPEDEEEEDDPSEDQITCSQLTRLRFELGDLAMLLRQANLTEEADKVDRARETLRSLQVDLVSEFESLDKTGAKNLADADMKAVTPILKAIKDEINLVAVSPVAIFDLARIWPHQFGIRYGLGGGVRVTLVNFNVTLGYAVNPQPRLREGRGAFFFSMDVTNLFR